VLQAEPPQTTKAATVKTEARIVDFSMTALDEA
jgi:hypothetical protein